MADRAGHFPGRAASACVVAVLALASCEAAPPKPDCKRASLTVSRMNEFWHALDRYRAAHGSYPAVGHDLDALAAALEPTWTARLPRLDAWDRPLRVDVTAEDWRVDSDADIGWRGDSGARLPLVISRQGLRWPLRECGCPGHLLRPPEAGVVGGASTPAPR